MERRASVHRALRPDRAVVLAHDSHYGRQADPVARKLALAVKPAEREKQPLGMHHLKTSAVISHEVHRDAILLDRPETNPGA